MTDKNEVIIVEDTSVVKTTFFDLTPQQMVLKATEIANALKDVVDKQHFKVKLGSGEHVKVEGWQTLGTLLGILPDEEEIIEHSDGAFEAKIALINMRSGVKVGGASSYCGMDEGSWAKKPKYARRSMAITRATGKAYKQAFGWIVHLAGYNATPAEEMEGLEIDRPNLNVLYTATAEQNKFLKELCEKYKVTNEDKVKIFSEIQNKKLDQLESIVAKYKGE